MCGITGFFDLSHSTTDDKLVDIIRSMMDSIRHRGPDDSGYWVDALNGIALGFRRLAILDISPTGHQPMISSDGRYVIIFNGEIYNFIDLRSELIAKGHTFKGRSDTEVILAAISTWQLEKAVERFNGMFAFALWDSLESCLHLVRDRVGIKPLYYGFMGRTLLFASELKSLRLHPAFHAEIDRNALTLYLRLNCIPSPYSIYRDIFKLAPGTILTIRPNGETHQRSYWSLCQVAERGVSNPLNLQDLELVDELDTLLRTSVRERMISDVPLGAFLSGGIDSSTIVALMQVQGDQPVKTFTIGFHEAAFDEAGYARGVAQHLGTDHTELYITPDDAMAVIPELSVLYDEPFADSSQIPAYLVAQLAREHVTVCLSGDGGDELFGGYSRYKWTRQMWQALGWLPVSFRRKISKILATSSRFVLKVSSSSSLCRVMDRIEKLSGILDVKIPEELYFHLFSLWEQPDSVVHGGNEPSVLLNTPSEWPHFPDYINWMMYADMGFYLPDDILVKLDRATMGVSLESRVPLLDDHRIIEFAWQVPLNMKVREGMTKWPLRQVLYRYVPRKLVDRPKAGFSIPLGSWLRNPLRGWAEDLLDEQRLRREGFFHVRHIRQKWDEHISGKRDWKYALWSVLMFQSWLGKYK